MTAIDVSNAGAAVEYNTSTAVSNFDSIPALGFFFEKKWTSPDMPYCIGGAGSSRGAVIFRKRPTSCIRFRLFFARI